MRLAERMVSSSGCNGRTGDKIILQFSFSRIQAFNRNKKAVSSLDDTALLLQKYKIGKAYCSEEPFPRKATPTTSGPALIAMDAPIL